MTNSMSSRTKLNTFLLTPFLIVIPLLLIASASLAQTTGTSCGNEGVPASGAESAMPDAGPITPDSSTTPKTTTPNKGPSTPGATTGDQVDPDGTLTKKIENTTYTGGPNSGGNGGSGSGAPNAPEKITVGPGTGGGNGPGTGGGKTITPGGPGGPKPPKPAAPAPGGPPTGPPGY